MIKKIFYFIILCFISVLIGFFLWFKTSFLSKTTATEYELKEGTSFTKLSYDLQKIGLIQYPKIFIFYAKFTHNDGNLKVGTYRFLEKMSPEEILNKFVLGKIETIKMTLPEGLNIYQTSQKLSEYFKKISYHQWLTLMEDKELIQILDLPEKIKNLEGFLYPQTYVFDPNLSPQKVLKSILLEFKKNVTKEMFQQAKKLGLSPVQYVTLASIIEKETSASSEREKVAGVYWNRLNIKMRLQADPTVIYGMWENYHGNLTKKDLLRPHPYNTYTQYGLPPGPIASPGYASLKATLNPVVSQYLYFVAKGDGTHVFSRNLAEHNKAVKQYLMFLQKNKKKED
jgi:UPF0755 protein